MVGPSARTYVLAAAAVAIGAFWLYVHFEERQPEVMKNTLVCPDCGKQLPGVGEKCPWCLAKKNREEIEAKARGDAPKPSSLSNGKLAALICGSVLLVVIAFWPRFRSLIEPRKEDEEYLDFRCEHCGRKLRYLASRAGMQGMCPRCKKTCRFPEAESRTAE